MEPEEPPSSNQRGVVNNELLDELHNLLSALVGSDEAVTIFAVRRIPWILRQRRCEKGSIEQEPGLRNEKPYSQSMDHLSSALSTNHRLLNEDERSDREAVEESGFVGGVHLESHF